jgi:hypothetical protein
MTIMMEVVTYFFIHLSLIQWQHGNVTVSTGNSNTSADKHRIPKFCNIKAADDGKQTERLAVCIDLI